MGVKIQLLRANASEWTAKNPTLDDGQPGFEKDTGKLKIGDGVSGWNDLSYITPDFINIVSSGDIADLTTQQQNDIVEGTIVLTSDGVRWIYSGTGSKTLEASYVQLADISPAWIQITSKPASLVGLADIASTAIGDFILATGDNTYQVVNFAESVDDRVGSLVIAGTGIGIDYNDSGNSLTVAVSGLISNPTDNRVLTSSDTNVGINAESNLTFDGTTLTVTGDIISNYIYSELDGTVVLPCKNNTASTINIGTPVYISGHFSNGKVYVAPADASDSAKMPAVGLLGSTLTSGSEGHVHIFGSLKLDTTGYGYVDPTDVGKTLYVASGGGLTLTRPTAETDLVQNIARLARIHNNGKYIILGPGRSNDVPNSISSYKLDIDNIRIDGNTVSSIDTNGNIVLAPNGSGDVQVDADTLRVGDTNTDAVITTNGTGSLKLSTNNDSTTGNIVIENGTNGNVNIGTASGTGNINLTTRSGIGANILVEGKATNANINIGPIGTGNVYSKGANLVVGTGSSSANINSNGAYNLILNGNAGTANVTIEGTASNPNVNINTGGSGSINLKTGLSGVGANVIIEGTVTNANVNIGPIGTGNVNAKGNSLIVGTGFAIANIYGSGAYNLTVGANSGSGGNIVLEGGATNDNVNVNAKGTGNINLSSGGNVIIEGSNLGNSNVNVNALGTGNIYLKTRSGSGANLVIEGTAINANVNIGPIGSGNVYSKGANLVVGTGSATANIGSNGAYNLILNGNTGTANIIVEGTGSNPNVNINTGGTGNITLRTNSGAGASIVLEGSNLTNNSNINITALGTGNVNISTRSGTGANIVIEGTATNAHVNICALGSGNIYAKTANIVVGSGAAATNITSDGAYSLTLSGNSISGGNIVLEGGSTNSNVNINAKGTGNVYIQTRSTVGANIIVEGTATNANVNISSLGSGNIYTKSSNLIVGSGSAQANISSNGSYDLLLTSGSSHSNIIVKQGANGAIILNTNGTGPLQRTSSGNARGSYAVDLQSDRSSVGSVASGSYSVIGGGYNNNLNGPYGVIVGGNNNLLARPYGIIGGGNNNSSDGGNYTTNTVIVGGGGNTIGGTYNAYTFIGGGSNNSISGSYNQYSNIIGGASNTINGNLGEGQGFSVISGGQLNAVSTSYSVIGGGFSNSVTTNGFGIIPGGFQGKATRFCEFSHAAGAFANKGDAQHTVLIARALTTTNTANQVLYLDNYFQKLILPAKTTWTFEVKLSAYNDTDSAGAGWIFRGAIRRDGSNNTAIVGSIITENWQDAAMTSTSANVVADDTNEALQIRVTGLTSKNIRWVAVTDISQVSYGTP